MKKIIIPEEPVTVLEIATAAEPTLQDETQRPKMKRVIGKYSLILGGLIVLALLSRTIFYPHKAAITIGERSVSAVGIASTATSSPDAVLLTINGKAIPRKVYTLSVNNIVQIAEAQKLDLKDKSIQQQIQSVALTNVVNTQILAQKAKTEGMSPDMLKVEQSFQNVAKSAGTPEKLADGLKQLSMTPEELRNAISDEILATAYINKMLGSQKIAISDEELKKAYEAEKSQLTAGGKTPEYKTVKAKLEESLLAQKRDQLIQAYLSELRKNAKIEFAGT